MERRAYYDAEPWYKREATQDWYQQMEKTNEKIKEILGEYISPHKSILEVGCGGGWLAEHILKAGARSYSGFDFSETAMTNARKRLSSFEDAKVWRADALSPLPYAKKYDCIIANQFFHCLIGKDRVQWLTNCRNALKAESVLIFSCSVGIPDSLRETIDPSSKLNKPGNRYYADEAEIKTELEAAGLELEEVIHPEDHSAIFIAGPRIH